MKKTYILFTVTAILFILFTAIIFARVPTPSEKDCLVVTGVVSNISEGGAKDIVFNLKDNKQLFYINRGLEQGYSLTTLKKELEGKAVTIKYPDYFSILDPMKTIRHISKVEHNGETIFSEVD